MCLLKFDEFIREELYSHNKTYFDNCKFKSTKISCVTVSNVVNNTPPPGVAK